MEGLIEGLLRKITRKGESGGDLDSIVYAKANYQEINCPDLTVQEQLGMAYVILRICNNTSAASENDKTRWVEYRKKAEARIKQAEGKEFDLDETLAYTKSRSRSNEKPNVLQGLEWLKLEKMKLDYQEQNVK